MSKSGLSAQVSEWDTISEAAKRFKLSPDTIRRMITRGEIEARRFGPRLIRVNLASIEAAGRPLQYIDHHEPRTLRRPVEVDHALHDAPDHIALTDAIAGGETE